MCVLIVFKCVQMCFNVFLFQMMLGAHAFEPCRCSCMPLKISYSPAHAPKGPARIHQVQGHKVTTNNIVTACYSPVFQMEKH